jgi:hypothetical protein
LRLPLTTLLLWCVRRARACPFRWPLHHSSLRLLIRLQRRRSSRLLRPRRLTNPPLLRWSPHSPPGYPLRQRLLTTLSPSRA